MHDNILVYQKSESFERGLLPRTEEQNARYSNPDNDPRGEWASDNYVSNKSKDERPTLWYPFTHPKTREPVWPDEHAVWRYSKEKHQEIEREGRLYWGPNQSYKKPRLKRYLKEVQDGIVPPTWWTFEDCGHNDEAQKETGALIGQKVFSTPKPVRLIDRMLTVGGGKDGIILDFFAGSGSTGHAVIARNASDNGNRRYILVQLPEPLDPESKDQKVAAECCDKLGKLRNIAELTKERLRRAAKNVQTDKPEYKGDLGFRVFKLASSNIRAWEPDRANLANTLEEAVEHLKRDRSEHDILYELLLKLGLDLCVPIETKSLADKTVYSIGGGVLITCLADKIARDEAETLGLGIVHWRKALKPAGDTTCVFRDSAFADDVAKTNLAAILQQNGISTVRSL
jgi:adenine-specific DNA-methyltransferase